MPLILHHTSINEELGKAGLPVATILSSPTVEDVSTSATGSGTTGLSAGVMAGIIVGVIVVVCAAGAGAYFCRRSQKVADLEKVAGVKEVGPTAPPAIASGPPSIWVPPSGQQEAAMSQTTVTTTTTFVNNLAAPVPAAQVAIIAEAGPVPAAKAEAGPKVEGWKKVADLEEVAGLEEAGPTAPPAIASAFCQQCGTANTGDTFCGGCGRKVN